MKISSLATMVTLATTVLLGCGGGTESPTEPSQLEGSWLFLGPSDGEHTLDIKGKSLKYAGLYGEWDSKWTLEAYDNEHHRFQITFESGNGTYYPSGQNFSGTYELKDVMLRVQLGKGLDSYPKMPDSSSCTDDDSKPIADCKLYMKQ